MDNLTHSFIGLAVAKAGLERLSPGATTLCVLAANSPDLDVVTLVAGRWVFLQQHRGISHSLLGAFVLALALPLTFYLIDLLLAHTRKHSRRVRLPGLVVASLIATATHPLMDWTNNYGVRFLLPWNASWSYGDFVFIIDPFLWIVLGGAGFLLTTRTRKHIFIWLALALIPSYLALVGRTDPDFPANALTLRILWVVALIVLVFLYRRNVATRAGARIALGALAVATLYCGGLALTHHAALRQARLQAETIAHSHNEQVVKLAAMPTAANPTAWVCVAETDRATYKFNLSLLHSDAANVIRYEKPTGLLAGAVAAAAVDTRAQVFLNFARFPVAQLASPDCVTQTLVQFADLRYTEPGRGRGTFSLDVPVECPALESGK
jgi:inner membrane protein